LILTKNRVKKWRTEPLTIDFYHDWALRIFSNFIKRKIFVRSFRSKKRGFWPVETWNSSFCSKIACFSFGGLWRARAVFSAVDLAGASFECCRCSKVVSHHNWLRVKYANPSLLTTRWSRGVAYYKKVHLTPSLLLEMAWNSTKRRSKQEYLRITLTQFGNFLKIL